MDQLSAMRILVKAADAGGFGRAAAQLDVSNATVTRAIGLLEAHLNTRLFNRTTRSLSLTEAGVSYVENCRRLLEELDEVESNIVDAARRPSGTLRIAVSSTFALFGMMPMLTAFYTRYPGVTVRMTLIDRVIDLVEEGYDIGIVPPNMVSSKTIVSRPLIKTRPIVVAAPGYLAQFKEPQRPSDLNNLSLLSPTVDSNRVSWDFEGPHGVEHINFEPIFIVNNALMLRQAALAGLGVSMLPDSVVVDDLRNGSLIQLLPEYSLMGGNIELLLVYPSREYQAKRTRAFIDLTTEYLTEYRQQLLAVGASI
ncbi:MAG: LysR family transcriptional regulator [Janthinobacterium lividum]